MSRRDPPSQSELLQGTLDLLILRTLLVGPAHGHAIGKHIQRSSEELLQIETGSLYPALHRLDAKGWIAASWALSDKGKRARFYRLTPLGRKRSWPNDRNGKPSPFDLPEGTSHDKAQEIVDYMNSNIARISMTVFDSHPMFEKLK